MFWVFGHKGCGILVPRPGIEPAPPALEDEVLTTGPPGKSQWCVLYEQRITAQEIILALEMSESKPEDYQEMKVEKA